MINILLKGVDEFLGAHVETVFTPRVASILKVNSDEVFTTCLHSIIYHGGVDQTSYHMIVTLELEEKYREYEQLLAKELLELSKSFAVHCHISFSYIDTPYYQRIEKNYPLFVTPANEVAIEEDEDDEEIYTGDIFASFEDKLK